MSLRLDVAGSTHVGLRRRRNEDALYAGQWLFAVADGLGGHPAGDVASSTVIETLKPHDRQVDPADLPAAIGRAVRASNDAISRRVDADAQLARMGSTLVALLRSGNTAVLANVGDSRAYLLRRNEPGHEDMLQITEDHVYGHLVADATDVPNLPERLTRWLDGRTDGRSPDVTKWDLRTGDRFLLCSDGLSSFVPRDLIKDALKSSDGPQETADRLVALTLDHEAPDNVTVIVLDVHDAD